MRTSLVKYATNATDLEKSTFQKRPAYRYIRKADRLPSTDEAHNAADPAFKVKLFDPTGSFTWLIAGYDPDTRRAYAAVKSSHTYGQYEVGDIDMAELVALRTRPFGLPIERDLYFDPMPMSAVLR